MRLDPETERSIVLPLPAEPTRGSERAPERDKPPRESSSRHYRLPIQPPFTRSERESVTLLCGGITPAHERLFRALLESRGFHVRVLPNPTLVDYQTGRRYANNGFCNPLYFMSGSLINHLQAKEAEGFSRESICAQYVYFTTSSTGPCRLGFYEQEFRNVLANAGYGTLRVIAFSDSVSMRAGEKGEGLPFDVRFYSDIFSAMILGDILTDICNRTRAYERERGATTRAYEKCMKEAEGRLARRARISTFLERYLPRYVRTPLEVGWRVMLWLLDPRFLRATLHVRRAFKEVKVNRLVVKPSVKLIGEFWAQTTQGDGNFCAHSFLEAHGAEVVVEPVSTWFLYLLFQAEQKARSAIAVHFHYPARTTAQHLSAAGLILRETVMIVLYRSAEWMYRGKYNLMRRILNGVPDPIPNMRTFALIAKRYYNPLLYGGESHMEIAKTLYYTGCNRVHAVFSLKPFGCMPSGMSDGIQPRVQADYPGTLFLSVETSGEGSTNAQSRMLMVLSEARQRARQEYSEALSSARLAAAGKGTETRTMHALSRLPRRGSYVTLAAQIVRGGNR